MARGFVLGMMATLTLTGTGSMWASSAPATTTPTVTAPTVTAPTVTAPTDGKALAEAVARVQKAYTQLQSLRADFTQTSKVPSVSRARVDSGTLELKKGGKMRWDFAKPEVRHFISDGKTLWIYTPAEKQVIQSSLQAGASQTALNFLQGLGDLTRDFTPSLATEAEFQKPGMSALHLAPKENIGMLKRLTVLVSNADGIVQEAVVKDHMGSLTRIVFSQLKINAPIADGRFDFKVPTGVELIQP